MEIGIIVVIISSSVAVIVAIISGIFSIKTHKLQKKTNNASLQIEYLNKKIMLLNEAKTELASSNNTKIDNSTPEKLNVAIADYANITLVVLQKVIYKLKGHVNNEKLNVIDKKVSRINNFIAYKKVQHNLPNLKKPSDDFSDIASDTINPIFAIRSELEQLIIEEMSDCTLRIEKIIEIHLP